MLVCARISGRDSKRDLAEPGCPTHLFARRQDKVCFFFVAAVPRKNSFQCPSPRSGAKKPPEYKEASGQSRLSSRSRNFNDLALMGSLTARSIKPDLDPRTSTKRKKPAGLGLDSEVTRGEDSPSP